MSATAPTRASAPLTPDFPSVFARYRAVFRIAWRAAMGYCLEAWQEDLLARITEINPATGRLRWRQYLISLGRQNGKTEIAAALGLLFMLWLAAPYVVGIASSAEQARLVYDRAMRVIRSNPALRERFDALTETRGIRAKDGGRWELKASKSAALQGLPISLAVVDEVHLVKPALWGDLVNGLGGRPDSLVAGITTAGDDSSTLLKRLYGEAEKGTIGFAIWEAPESHVPDDDVTLGEYLTAANPAIASGRVDLATVIQDCRTMPDPDVLRFRLNRFVASQDTFMPVTRWAASSWADDGAAGDGAPRAEEFPQLPSHRIVFTIDRTPEWSYATVTATARADDGTLYTQVAASIVRPDLARLERVCLALDAQTPGATYAMDGYGLKELAEMLRRDGLNTQVLRQADVISASSFAYAAIVRGRVRHPGDPLLTAQLPRTARKNIGNAFRIVRQDSGSDIDAVMATVLGLYCAETLPDVGVQVF